MGYIVKGRLRALWCWENAAAFLKRMKKLLETPEGLA